jgi:hypothetical protein
MDKAGYEHDVRVHFCPSAALPATRDEERSNVVPSSIKIPVPFAYVFPSGALLLGVDKVVDFDRLSEDDNQARDENGVRLWTVKVMDQDPEAGRFGRSTEVKVKIAADEQPEAPAGIRLPSGVTVTPVEFANITVTPYSDSVGCRGERKPHKCRARLAWSIRATGMVAPAAAGTAASVA